MRRDILGPDQLCFAIVQGGTDVALRHEHLQSLSELDFDGFALGGLSVGEPIPQMHATLAAIVPSMPQTKPRYVMGIGTPADLLAAIRAGVDMFDCVIPFAPCSQRPADQLAGPVQHPQRPVPIRRRSGRPELRRARSVSGFRGPTCATSTPTTIRSTCVWPRSTTCTSFTNGWPSSVARSGPATSPRSRPSSTACSKTVPSPATEPARPTPISCDFNGLRLPPGTWRLARARSRGSIDARGRRCYLSRPRTASSGSPARTAAVRTRPVRWSRRTRILLRPRSCSTHPCCCSLKAPEIPSGACCPSS